MKGEKKRKKEVTIISRLRHLPLTQIDTLMPSAASVIYCR